MNRSGQSSAFRRSGCGVPGPDLQARKTPLCGQPLAGRGPSPFAGAIFHDPWVFVLFSTFVVRCFSVGEGRPKRVHHEAPEAHEEAGCTPIDWWARQGSNLQGLLQRILSPSRLPIPPRAQTQYGLFVSRRGGRKKRNSPRDTKFAWACLGGARAPQTAGQHESKVGSTGAARDAARGCISHFGVPSPTVGP
jgi:hypothetical protein